MIYNVSLYPLIVNELMPKNMTTVKPVVDTAAEKPVIYVPTVFNQCRPDSISDTMFIAHLHGHWLDGDFLIHPLEKSILTLIQCVFPIPWKSSLKKGAPSPCFEQTGVPFTQGCFTKFCWNWPSGPKEDFFILPLTVFSLFYHQILHWKGLHVFLHLIQFWFPSYAQASFRS